MALRRDYVEGRERTFKRKPRLLDLFCGAGGAAMGYHRAGFDVVGVDIKPQPHYPFEFHQGDAIGVLKGGLATLFPYSVRDFDAVHASPPCQRYTALRTREDLSSYPDLVPSLRNLLRPTGLPWVIENVPGAPLRPDMILCGAMFGLRTYRHRLFEFSGDRRIQAPVHPPHLVRVNRRGENRREHWANGGFLTITGDIGSYVGPEGMGIDWMTGNELREAIPPAYTEVIGKQLLAEIAYYGAGIAV